MKHVEALYGPYAGGIISLEDKDADKAIEDGWARDPYDPKNAAPVDLSERTQTVDTEKATKAAEEYAAKLRGEEPKKARRTTSETRAATAGQSANYQTRDSKPESKSKPAEE